MGLHKSNKPPKIKVEPDRIKLVQVSSLIERWTLFEQLTDCFADGAMANTVNSDNIELFMVAADMDLNAFISDYLHAYESTEFIKEISSEIKSLSTSRCITNKS